MRRRQDLRNAAEAGADRLDGDAEAPDGERGEADRDDEGRPMRTNAPDEKDGADRERGDEDGRAIHARRRRREGGELRNEGPRLLVEREAEKLLQLACKDDECDAAG